MLCSDKIRKILEFQKKGLKLPFCPFDFRFTKLWGPKSPARSCAPSSTLGPSVTRWCQSVKSSRHFDGSRQQPHLFCTKSSSRTKTSFYAKMCSIFVTCEYLLQLLLNSAKLFVTSLLISFFSFPPLLFLNCFPTRYHFCFSF